MRVLRAVGTIAVLIVAIFEVAYQLEVHRMRRDYEACQAGHCPLGHIVSLGNGQRACSYHDANAWRGQADVSCMLER